MNISRSIAIDHPKENETSTDNENTNNHLLYLEGLKLYGRNQTEIETLIYTLGTFSDDIGIAFELDECATIRRNYQKEYQGHFLVEGKYNN